jgi:hypothetical protein
MQRLALWLTGLLAIAVGVTAGAAVAGGSPTPLRKVAVGHDTLFVPESWDDPHQQPSIDPSASVYSASDGDPETARIRFQAVPVIAGMTVRDYIRSVLPDASIKTRRGVKCAQGIDDGVHLAVCGRRWKTNMIFVFVMSEDKKRFRKLRALDLARRIASRTRMSAKDS